MNIDTTCSLIRILTLPHLRHGSVSSAPAFITQEIWITNTHWSSKLKKENNIFVKVQVEEVPWMCKIQTGCFLSRTDQTDLTPGAGQNSASLNIRTNSQISAGHTLAFCLILICCFYSWLLFELRNLKPSSSETYIKISIKFTLKLLITQILKIENQTAQDWGATPVWVSATWAWAPKFWFPSPTKCYMCLWGEQGQQNPELAFQSSSGFSETAYLRGIDEG